LDFVVPGLDFVVVGLAFVVSAFAFVVAGTPYRARIASSSKATMLVILIAGLTAGPAVSL
jgi:hypothetical protein